MTRCAEMHCWPLASNAAPAMRVAASARSASASTIFAALEPSSPDELLGAGRADKLVAGSRAAGERDDRNQRVGYEGARRVAPARHDIEQAVRHARLLERLGDQERDFGAGRRRLHHDRVADGQRRRDFLDQQIGRPIERRDGADDAIGHPNREAEAARARSPSSRAAGPRR